MSAPLVVNTTDGTVWTRRSVTRGGLALYAMADVVCPELVMATLAELAEHGIAGSADVLPMPVGPKPLTLPEQQIDALAAAGNRVVNDAVHERLCMCDTWPESCLSSGNFHMGDWDMSGLESALPAVLGLWEQMRGGELESLRARVADAVATVARLEQKRVELERIANAERSRVAELESLLRESMAQVAAADVRLNEIETVPFSLDAADVSADRLTRLFAPTQALREDIESGGAE